jgi:hypothetical protein
LTCFRGIDDGVEIRSKVLNFKRFKVCLFLCFRLCLPLKMVRNVFESCNELLYGLVSFRLILAF